MLVCACFTHIEKRGAIAEITTRGAEAEATARMGPRVLARIENC
jgi:hypothetical protein